MKHWSPINALTFTFRRTSYVGKVGWELTIFRAQAFPIFLHWCSCANRAYGASHAGGAIKPSSKEKNACSRHSNHVLGQWFSMWGLDTRRVATWFQGGSWNPPPLHTHTLTPQAWKIGVPHSCNLLDAWFILFSYHLCSWQLLHISLSSILSLAYRLDIHIFNYAPKYLKLMVLSSSF